jgi:hypothetical protein
VAKPKIKKMASATEGDTLNDVNKDSERRNKLVNRLASEIVNLAHLHPVDRR